MDKNPSHDGPWTDGDRAHHCGYYVEDHSLSEDRDARGRRRWVCPLPQVGENVSQTATIKVAQPEGEG